MKNVKNIIFCFLTLLLIGVVVISCNKEDNNSGISTIKVSLTDLPGDYEAVNIDVQDVKIKRSNDSGDNGWVSIGNITPGIYNLLELTGGIKTIIADNDIPSGYLGQMRLVLGENNTVVINGVSHQLDTPSAQQSGLKLKINQTLQANITYNFLLDFDADKSIVSAGNSGKYILKPVIRASLEAISGSIKGTVNANGFKVLASVLVGSEVVSAYSNENGIFVLHGIPAGTYTLTLTPATESGFEPKTIENVIVTNEQITDVGLTTFP